jgi:OFA family oxalate/formate antiporter-like MFS transporter
LRYVGYRVVAGAFVAQFFAAGVQNYVAGAFMLPMCAELGWTRAEFTWPRTVGQFVFALTGLLIGSHVDRIGARRFVLTGAFVLALALALLGRVETLLGWLLLNGVVLSVGAALIGNLVVNVTLAKWFVELRGRAVAWSAMGVSMAGIVLTPAAAASIDLWGWRVAWPALAVLTLCCVAPVAWVMHRQPEDFGLHPDGRSAAEVAQGLGARAAADYRRSLTRAQALRTPAFYLLVLAFALFTINIGVMLLQTIPFMTDAGWDRTTAALMITVASVPALVSKPIWGHFIDRAEPRPLAAGGALLTGLSVLVILAGASATSLAVVVTGFFLLGCGWGGMIPLTEVIWASYFGRRHLGAVRSAALPFSLVLGAAAPLAVSYYHDVVGSYAGAFLAVAIANVASAGLILRIPRPGGD